MKSVIERYTKMKEEQRPQLMNPMSEVKQLHLGPKVMVSTCLDSQSGTVKMLETAPHSEEAYPIKRNEMRRQQLAPSG
nr:MADS-box transcription factor 23-like isoform X2 [Ipomoea batatas]